MSLIKFQFLFSFIIVISLQTLLVYSSNDYNNFGSQRIKEKEINKIQRWQQVFNDTPISEEEEEDTAPPEIGIIPELSIEKGRPPTISNKFLRKLSAQQLANQRAKLHRGGNLRGPVNFEEALKVTVPYDS
ncbi:hypothetical protein Mgra_00000895 [Meloidogyne graminicola]|uniref:Uncharacterized protein n=1 Tax=Meloidogyne graminicola TaxID=189291 RepID=A0A8T0A2N1_9BILA|nr:hypothetical protein Mgra_00000895 [Meloidogyne graminicola]